MQIVIDIPEHIYEHAKEESEDSRDEFEAMRAIANGSQQRTGRWIEYVEPNDAEPLVLWRCENCDTVKRRKTSYCPNCGCKMEVEE